MARHVSAISSCLLSTLSASNNLQIMVTSACAVQKLPEGGGDVYAGGVSPEYLDWERKFGKAWREYYQTASFQMLRCRDFVFCYDGCRGAACGIFIFLTWHMLRTACQASCKYAVKCRP